MFDGPIGSPGVSYTIDISRGTGIALDEWEAFVASRNDLRLRREPLRFKGGGGEVINLGLRPGDTDALIGGEWTFAFRWRDGDEEVPSSVTFDAPRDFHRPTCAIRKLARDIAGSLKATMTGQEGESYE